MHAATLHRRKAPSSLKVAVTNVPPQHFYDHDLETRASAEGTFRKGAKIGVKCRTPAPQVVREITLPALEAGASLVVLSIGAFADSAFLEQASEAARRVGRRIHLASGAIGGFDVLRTTALMSAIEASITTEKGPASLRNTPVFDERLMTDTAKTEVFAGSAKDAIALFPTKVNVAVATALATAGAEQTRVSINSVPGFAGDDHRIEVRGEEVHAVVDIYSRTSAIAGWSIVALLRNLVSPIAF